MLTVLNMTGKKVEGVPEQGGIEPHLGFDDEYHDGIHYSQQIDSKKSNKPVMEKRRRARINTCLNELKSLILKALNKDGSRQSKLEKADILEMTVKHLQSVQRQQLAVAVSKDPPVFHKFKNGFNECAREISRYVSRIDGVDAGVRQRLLDHLSRTTTNLNATSPAAFASMAGIPMAHGIPGAAPAVGHPPQEDFNHSHARFINRLIAARLAASGDNTGAAMLMRERLNSPDNRSLISNVKQLPTNPAEPLTATVALKLIKNESVSPMVSSINDGASSSKIFSSRNSAFTAVKKNNLPQSYPEELSRKVKSPEETKPPIIVAPTAVRLIPRPINQRTMQSKAIDKLYNVDVSLPKTKNNGKRSLEQEVSDYYRPVKQIKVENSIKSHPCPVSSSLSSPPNLHKNRISFVLNPSKNSPNMSKSEENDEDRDMWRPW